MTIDTVVADGVGEGVEGDDEPQPNEMPSASAAKSIRVFKDLPPAVSSANVLPRGGMPQRPRNLATNVKTGMPTAYGDYQLFSTFVIGLVCAGGRSTFRPLYAVCRQPRFPEAR